MKGPALCVSESPGAQMSSFTVHVLQQVKRSNKKVKST